MPKLKTISLKSSSSLSLQVLGLTLAFSLTIVPCTSKPFEGANSRENEIQENEIEELRQAYAKQMLSYMNRSVDPCEDFYEYACGNWKNAVQEKLVHTKRSNFFEIFSEVAIAFDAILQRPNISLEKDYQVEFKLAQQYYQTCLDADIIPPRKSAEYLKIIKEIGGFPAVDEAWNPEKFSWFNMSAHLTNYGVSGFLKEQIHVQHPFPPVLKKKPELGFGFPVSSDNIQTNTSNAYVANEQRMRKYLTVYGVNETMSSEVIAQIFNLWKAVLKMADKFGSSSKCTLTAPPEEQPLAEKFSQWDSYFDIAWNGKQFGFSADEYACVSFYTQLNEICEQHKYAVANYLALAFLYEMDPKIGSINEQKEYCVRHVRDMSTYLMDLLYLQEHFNSVIKEDITVFITELKNVLQSVLKDNEWLDEETKLEALLKASSISPRIGNNENPLFIDQLIREMNNLTAVAGSFEQNNLQVHKFKTSMKRYLGLRSELIDNSTRPMDLKTATEINAYYYPVDNSINIMAGILHPPVYQHTWPNCLKFGTLGFLIGHELSHAYDSVGRLYDGSGQFRDWWSQNSSAVFEDRANCLVESFSDFFITEINRYVDGEITKDENIADNVGLGQAFKACRNSLKAANKVRDKDLVLQEQTMPGMDFSPEQLFFLGFSQVWCSAYKEEHVWLEVNDEHVIDKYRVLGALRNSEEFAQVFECPLGSKMNPHQEKCRVL